MVDFDGLSSEIFGRISGISNGMNRFIPFSAGRAFQAVEVSGRK
jgi:hypothetical protein